MGVFSPDANGLNKIGHLPPDDLRLQEAAGAIGQKNILGEACTCTGAGGTLARVSPGSS